MVKEPEKLPNGAISYPYVGFDVIHVHVIGGGLSDPRCLRMIALEWPELALVGKFTAFSVFQQVFENT